MDQRSSLPDRVIASTGLLWLVSWFGLYLEVFRYHHVRLSYLGNVMWPAASEGARPGAFVRSVVVCSILAPVAFLVALILNRRRAALPSEHSRPALLSRSARATTML